MEDDDTAITTQSDEAQANPVDLEDLERGLEASIQYAKKYLEDLLSFFGLNIEVHATTSDEEVIELNVPSSHLNGFLIGQRGDTMRALQFIIMSALKNNGFAIVRVSVDVADYKKARADRLAEKAQVWLQDVQKSGKPKSLPPMNAADRRIVHKLANDLGLETRSEGEGRERHIVISPASGQVAAEEPSDNV